MPMIASSGYRTKGLYGCCRGDQQQFSFGFARNPYINPAINYVIPAAAKRRAGIQRTPRFYWICAFAEMTGE